MASDDFGASDDLSHARLSFSLAEIEEIKHRVANGASYSKRLSFALCVRLAELESQYNESQRVLDEIDALEALRSATSTKESAPFRRGLLKNFWHQHFSTSRHIIRNFGERWNLGRGENKDLDDMIRSVAGEFGDQPSLWQKALAYKLVMGGIEERSAARRMTGDWIIFAKGSKGENYYLDLATHEEGEHSDELFEKLRLGCEWEFPEFFCKRD